MTELYELQFFFLSCDVGELVDKTLMINTFKINQKEFWAIITISLFIQIKHVRCC